MALPWFLRGCGRGAFLNTPMNTLPRPATPLNGLDYLHSVNITHGDLCAWNILINDQGHPLLADFGPTETIDESPGAAGKLNGSTHWMAPEFFRQPFQRTTASDIWAFGCVYCETWTGGRKPYKHIDSDSGVVALFLRAHDEKPDVLQSWSSQSILPRDW
ncbi:kinase-like domain-containing protein [Mycena rebaudengoi]|nr:kinase-like domain-containing protein [Mycena rebaudengoi]